MAKKANKPPTEETPTKVEEIANKLRDETLAEADATSVDQEEEQAKPEDNSEHGQTCLSIRKCLNQQCCSFEQSQAVRTAQRLIAELGVVGALACIIAGTTNLPDPD